MVFLAQFVWASQIFEFVLFSALSRSSVYFQVCFLVLRVWRCPCKLMVTASGAGTSIHARRGCHVSWVCTGIFAGDAVLVSLPCTGIDERTLSHSSEHGVVCEEQVRTRHMIVSTSGSGSASSCAPRTSPCSTSETSTHLAVQVDCCSSSPSVFLACLLACLLCTPIRRSRSARTG